MARFFLPLPEPLGLPDGWTREMRGPVSVADLLALDASEELPHDVVPMDYSQDQVLDGSIRIVRARSQTRNPFHFDAVMGALREALPGLLPPPRDEQEREAFNIEITVADVVVPYAEDASVESGDNDGLTTSFEAALNLVREIQRAYHMVRREPITLVARERLPPTVPYVIARSDATDLDEVESGLFMLHHNLYGTVRDPDLSDDELERVDVALGDLSRGRAFARFVEFRREAHVALRRDGDYGACVVWTATAAETLLDELLQHLMWEEARRPEDCLGPFETFLATRVRTAYHTRLGGRWQLDGSGAIAKWYASIAASRNRVVHSGHFPSPEEASEAMSSLDALLTWICDLLARPRNLTTYPRTAITLIGEDGLHRRGRMSARLRDLQANPDEPDWRVTFARWKDAHALLRQESQGVPREPMVARAHLLAVLCPSGALYWCLHDRDTRQAAEVPDQRAVLSAPEQEGLQAALRRAAELAPEDAISIAFSPNTYRGRSPRQWLEQYRLVPMAEVMVDGSDLDRCRAQPPSPTT